MDYQLERRIRFINSTEHPTLYTWALRELDKYGTTEWRDQIPWSWNTWFSCKELSLQLSIGAERIYNKEKTSKIYDKETIRGIFSPTGSVFSFFGSNRPLDKFDVVISLKDDGEDESCSAWGSITYTHEVDFEEHTQPDCVQVYVLLNRERFDKLKQFILADIPIKAILRLSMVSGFYAEWSPSIRTSNIKILADAKTQNVEIPEGEDFALPILGAISDFDLLVEQERQELRKIDHSQSSHFLDKNLLPLPSGEKQQKESDYNEALAQLAKTASAIKLPIWITVALLFLTLIK